MDFYIKMGNEIFAENIAQLAADPLNSVTVVHDQLTYCVFPDGSTITFDNGYAAVDSGE